MSGKEVFRVQKVVSINLSWLIFSISYNILAKDCNYLFSLFKDKSKKENEDVAKSFISFKFFA